MNINKEIWIVAEQHQNMIIPVTYQLISKANTIKGDKKVVVILFETSKQTLENLIKNYGPDEIIVIKNDKLLEAPDSLIADLLAQLNHLRKPNSILFGATVVGRSVSPRLQAKLRTGLTADCLDLSFEDDLLIQTKPSYGDNVMCEIVCPNNLPQMATVRPNIFIAKKETKDVVITEIKDLLFKTNNAITVRTETPLLSKSDNLVNASKVIAIGRGIAQKDEIDLAYQLANKLGAKVGVTRPLTDLAQFSVDDQIGQSGSSISPKFLLTLGIHGAAQFTSGIGKSNIIVAVNTNPKAPIFDSADYSYVGDAAEFVKELLKAL